MLLATGGCHARTGDGNGVETDMTQNKQDKQGASPEADRTSEMNLGEKKTRDASLSGAGGEREEGDGCCLSRSWRRRRTKERERVRGAERYRRRSLLI